MKSKTAQTVCYIVAAIILVIVAYILGDMLGHMWLQSRQGTKGAVTARNILESKGMGFFCAFWVAVVAALLFQDFIKGSPAPNTSPRYLNGWISVNDHLPIRLQRVNFIAYSPHSEYHGKVLAGVYIGGWNNALKKHTNEFSTPGYCIRASYWRPSPEPTPDAQTIKL